SVMASAVAAPTCWKLGASRTWTAKPLPGLNVTVTVAGALAVACEFTAVYWKVTVDATVVGGVVGAAVNEPSGFRVTVPPTGAPLITAVSGCACGSVSFSSTPGGETCILSARLLAYVSGFAVGAPPTQE